MSHAAPGRAPRLLIVNADDFGLTRGVSRAIIRAHREGVVTSTSVLALGPAFTESVALLDDVPALGVGIHLAAVGEDPPLLGAREIPSLVGRRGRLPLSWRQFLPRLAARRIDVADVEREFRAQIELVRSRVDPDRITHLDTHQHLHLWPSIGALVCRLAARDGVPAVRVTRSVGGSARGRVVNRLASGLARRATGAGLLVPDGFAGFDEAGAVTAARLVSVIDQLGRSGTPSAELAIHPGEHDDDDLGRYEWGYRWGDELDALVAPATRDAVTRAGFTLGTFAALATVPQ